MQDHFLTVDDILEFLGRLQEEADVMVCLYMELPVGMLKYETMCEICDNAWHQAQLRAWMLLVTENQWSNILDIEDDLG